MTVRRGGTSGKSSIFTAVPEHTSKLWGIPTGMFWNSSEDFPEVPPRRTVIVFRHLRARKDRKVLEKYQPNSFSRLCPPDSLSPNVPKAESSQCRRGREASQ